MCTSYIRPPCLGSCALALLCLAAVGCAEPGPLDRDQDRLNSVDDTTQQAGGESVQTQLHDGSYVGEIIIVGSVPALDVADDSCAGGVSVDVAAAGEPQLTGIATCAFDGWLGAIGDPHLAVTGGCLGSNGAQGQLAVTVDGLLVEQSWSGTWDGDTLSASIDGTVLLPDGDDQVEAFFEGSFTLWPASD